jgi:pre-rRNA-processing protein TSR2
MILSVAVTKMPDEHAAAFCEGLAGILNRWTALQLAILNEWGGAESAAKGAQMLEELEHWFLRRRAGKYAEDLEELLVEILGDDFCVQCEDGSPREVAKIACEMYEQVAEGNYALARDVCAKPLPREHLERCQREEEDRRWTAGASTARLADGGGGGSDGSDDAMDADDLAAGLDGFSMKHDPEVDDMSTGGRRGQPEPDEDGWCTVPKRGGR